VRGLRSSPSAQRADPPVLSVVVIFVIVVASTFFELFVALVIVVA
jgi:hypothetical protein